MPAKVVRPPAPRPLSPHSGADPVTQKQQPVLEAINTEGETDKSLKQDAFSFQEDMHTNHRGEGSESRTRLHGAIQ